MGDIRLRKDTLKAKCTYKYILTGINKEESGENDGYRFHLQIYTFEDVYKLTITG